MKNKDWNEMSMDMWWRTDSKNHGFVQKFIHMCSNNTFCPIDMNLVKVTCTIRKKQREHKVEHRSADVTCKG